MRSDPTKCCSSSFQPVNSAASRSTTAATVHFCLSDPKLSQGPPHVSPVAPPPNERPSLRFDSRGCSTAAASLRSARCTRQRAASEKNWADYGENPGNRTRARGAHRACAHGHGARVEKTPPCAGPSIRTRTPPRARGTMGRRSSRPPRVDAYVYGGPSTWGEIRLWDLGEYWKLEKKWRYGDTDTYLLLVPSGVVPFFAPES